MDDELSLFKLPPLSKPRRRQPSEVKDLFQQARRFHGWTLDKLEVLRLYLKMYRRVAGSGAYLDAFAGEGRALIRGKEYPSSAELALRSGAFRQLHFFELPEVAERLERNLRYWYGQSRLSRCRIYRGDCNITIPDVLASDAIDRNRPCFAFLDPNSTELAWATIEHLASYKIFDPVADPIQCKVEIWVLFNSHQAIVRLWTRDRARYQVPPHADVLDAVMGGRSAWLDLYRDGLGVESLITRYCEGFIDLGYQYVEPCKILNPDNRSVQYVMVHATDHPAAVDFMAWARRTPTEELSRQALLPL